MEVSSTDMGAAGAMMHGVLHAGMCGRVKADDNDMGNPWVYFFIPIPRPMNTVPT